MKHSLQTFDDETRFDCIYEWFNVTYPLYGDSGSINSYFKDDNFTYMYVTLLLGAHLKHG